MYGGPCRNWNLSTTGSPRARREAADPFRKSETRSATDSDPDGRRRDAIECPDDAQSRRSAGCPAGTRNQPEPVPAPPDASSVGRFLLYLPDIPSCLTESTTADVKEVFDDTRSCLIDSFFSQRPNGASMPNTESNGLVLI